LIPGKTIFLFATDSGSVLVPHNNLSNMYNVSSLGIKRSGRKAKHAHPSNVMLKMCATTRLHTSLHAVVLR
jgi:hypothetical protein